MAWPTTSDPRTEFVTLRMTKGEAADLDWLQGQIGASNRSDTLREALSGRVASERRKKRRQSSSARKSAGLSQPNDAGA